MKLIWKYIREHLGIVVLSTTFLTLEALADLLQPTFMSYIVDNGVRNADVGQILVYGAIMLGIAAFGAFSAVMRNIFASRTSQTVGMELRRDIYHSVQKLSLENIDHLQPASIITRITNDVTQVQDFINSIMRMMIKAPITCVGAIALILIQTPKQAPIMLVILILTSLLTYGNIRVGYPRYGRVQRALDALNGVAREFLTSVRVVKAFHAEDAEMRKFRESSENLSVANMSALRSMATFAPLINLTVNMGVVALLWISRNQEAAQIGRLMASVNYMTQVMFAVGMISNVINVAVRAIASSERIQEVLDEKPAQKQAQKPVAADVSGSVTFSHVSFAYAGSSQNALEDISFAAAQGETIGIIGPTGSGKSTLANLVPRFYDAVRGSVCIDGVNVNDMDTETLRVAVAVAPQKALLFSGSISENLRWGRSDATDEEVRSAVRIACAEEFIEDIPEGYAAQLGQNGVNLSGGQKQRLCLARALLRKPRILILDDCTSALDASTESTVLKGLANLPEKCTILLISQRISTVMRADKVLCLDQGRVQGYGTHRELMRSCDTYRAIYASQIGGEEHV